MEHEARSKPRVQPPRRGTRKRKSVHKAIEPDGEEVQSNKRKRVARMSTTPNKKKK